MNLGTHDEAAEATTAPATADKINHLKPQVDPATLAWRELRRDPFWQKIPAWSEVDEETFLDHKWRECFALKRNMSAWERRVLDCPDGGGGGAELPCDYMCAALKCYPKISNGLRSCVADDR